MVDELFIVLGSLAYKFFTQKVSLLNVMEYVF